MCQVGVGGGPTRRLVFTSDVPKLPRPCRRYLTPDLDEWLAAALRNCPNQLVGNGFLSQRATDCGSVNWSFGIGRRA